MPLQRFASDSLPATPWRNGGGSTLEIACWPPGASLDAFEWRVSIAAIAASGPFSVFAGVDRHIMLLRGDGVRLRSADGRFDHRLDAPHYPFAFRGDDPIDCTLLAGPSTDFNVMARRGRWRAVVQVVADATRVDPAMHGVLLSLRGEWRVERSQAALPEGSGVQAALPEASGLWWADIEQGWTVEPEQPKALLAVFRFLPASGSASSTRP